MNFLKWISGMVISISLIFGITAYYMEFSKNGKSKTLMVKVEKSELVEKTKNIAEERKEKALKKANQTKHNKYNNKNVKNNPKRTDASDIASRKKKEEYNFEDAAKVLYNIDLRR